MKVLRSIKWILLALILLFAAAFLHYNLPRTAVVRIEGTDVKRSDTAERQNAGKPATAPAGGTVTDVRYINTMTRDNKVLVLRNEDTGWGWPPYFKFNSADITAQAQAFAKADPPPWVLVKFYGWRIRMLSLFPNVIGLKVVDREYSALPWFNIIFLTLLLGGLIAIGLKLRQWGRAIRARFQKPDAAARD
jgi:hypothetical protein